MWLATDIDKEKQIKPHFKKENKESRELPNFPLNFINLVCKLPFCYINNQLKTNIQTNKEKNQKKNIG